MTTAYDQAAFYEALLFIAERPLSTAELAELSGVSRTEAESTLGRLAEDLAERGRGLRLQQMDGAWQLATAPEVGARLAAYAAREEARLTPAALEALAVVAYRQPCTRGEVDRVRGVDSDYVLRSLLHRRLVVEVGRRDTPGRPILYGTTFTFLERFGLTSLEELPPIGSIEPTEAADPTEAAVLPAAVEPGPVDAG
jgi:segregation and condensation protein B